MAGFREFVTGEVLTASNVDDFLAKQAVMKFADAAARGSALGTAVGGGNALREGMVAYLDDEDQVQYFDGTAWDAISQPNAGIGSNVVQTVKTTSFSTTSTSFVDVTNFDVSITPSTATSKILVIANYSAGNAGGDQTTTRLLRDSTAIMDPSHFYGHFGSERNRDRPNITAVYLDSPATASAVTYKLQIKTSAGTAYFNRDVVSTPNVCTITVVEVAV